MATHLEAQETLKKNWRGGGQDPIITENISTTTSTNINRKGT